MKQQCRILKGIAKVTGGLMMAVLLTLPVTGIAGASGPTIVPGSVDGTQEVAGTRYRAFNKPSDYQIFVGRHDLGVGSNRSQKRMQWVTGINTFTFTYDKVDDKLVTTVVNSNGNNTVEYTDFSTKLADPSLINEVDVVHLTIRKDSAATVNLVDIYLDGNPLGNFTGGATGTWSTWSVRDYDFSQGFTITGTVELGGSLSTSSEANKVQIMMGILPGGSLSITHTPDWQEVIPDKNQTFEICINGPSHPYGSCQISDFDGGTLTWDNLKTGSYTVTQTDPGDNWSVNISDSVANVQPGQNTAATIANTYVSRSSSSGYTIFLPIIFR